MTELRNILLAEDNPNDVELTLSGLAELRLVNEVTVVRDGAEAPLVVVLLAVLGAVLAGASPGEGTGPVR